MSRRNTGTSGLSKSSSPGGSSKTEPNKAGPFPSTYFGNSRDCNTDRYQKDGQKGGGQTRKGK